MKNFFLFILLALVLATNAYAADLEKEMKICSKIEDNIERLECYDNIITKKPNIQSSDNWIIREDVSELTDQKGITFITKAVTPIASQFGQEIYPTLVLRCQDNTTDVYINWSMFLGTETISVTERIDKEKAVKSSWTVSTSYEAIFNNRPIKFIKNLLNKEKLLVQLVPYGEGAKMTEFNIQDLENIIAPMQELCHWK